MTGGLEKDAAKWRAESGHGLPYEYEVIPTERSEWSVSPRFKALWRDEGIAPYARLSTAPVGATCGRPPNGHVIFSAGASPRPTRGIKSATVGADRRVRPQNGGGGKRPPYGCGAMFSAPFKGSPFKESCRRKATERLINGAPRSGHGLPYVRLSTTPVGAIHALARTIPQSFSAGEKCQPP